MKPCVDPLRNCLLLIHIQASVKTDYFSILWRLKWPKQLINCIYGEWNISLIRMHSQWNNNAIAQDE